MTQGLAAQLGFKLQKYNYAKGCPEPVDLTGKQISFRAYDPRSMKIEAGMQMTTAEGKKYAGTVELDADEKGEFFLLEGKAEEEAFVNKVLKRRGELTLKSFNARPRRPRSNSTWPPSGCCFPGSRKKECSP